ncbi:MAG: succinate dehydrogenase, cytochrome b556 subunit [Azoarcus sp.]|jgi:succinate dehydrogenase / fumarate reductase cytochrome b subunit|nr:succinate dehydrogenase, cytochrome b556 subunit [Azoarcus sp.]
MSEVTVVRQEPRPRPKYLDVFELGMRLPLPGFLSILHRVSGAGLFLLLPFLLFLLDRSLTSPGAFDSFREIVANPLARLLLLGLLWAYLHHFCAGIRFLLIDVHIGVGLPEARKSTIVVFAVSLALTLIFGVALW